MRSYVLAAVAAFAGAAGAQADIIMQSQSFGPSTPNFSQALTFNQYNGPASDILSISIKLQLDIDGGRLELDNDGADPASGTAQLGAAAQIGSMDVSLIDIAFMPVVGQANAFNATGFNLQGDDGDTDGVFDVGGADYFLFNGTPASNLQMGLINPAVFGDYAGPGTFDINVDVNQIFDYGAIGGISFAGSPVVASGNVMITYEIIPAPGAAALLGLGGLVAIRRRR